jgi:hypothetical protein
VPHEPQLRRCGVIAAWCSVAPARCKREWPCNGRAHDFRAHKAGYVVDDDKRVRKYDGLVLDFSGAVCLGSTVFGCFRVASLCYVYPSGTQGIGMVPHEYTAAEIWPVRPPFVVAAFWSQICHENSWRICHKNWPHLVMTDLSKISLTDTSNDFLWQIFTNFFVTYLSREFLWQICHKFSVINYDGSVIIFLENLS